MDLRLLSLNSNRQHGVHDEDLWNSPDPMGAIIGIDIPGPNNGSFIVSQSNLTG